jgi:hypothetical protein
MGLFDFFSSLKTKAQDVTMDKALERMRDLKMPIAEKKVRALLATHVACLPGVKHADVDITRGGIVVKASFNDGRPGIRRELAFVELMWTSHKRAFVFRPAASYDYLKDQATYACVAALMVAVLQQMLGFDAKKLKEENFSHEVGPVTGVLDKDGTLHFDLRRIPVTRQYVNYRVMGQSPIEHLNVTDCWFENGRVMVRVDNNKLVDQIRNMNLDPAALRKMMKGDYSDFTGDDQK